ncbi:MAG TPA: hypothetical protein DEB68_05580 [Bacteroides sp.]|nr:hypothetical protein [Bacteroides sp.]
MNHFWAWLKLWAEVPPAQQRASRGSKYLFFIVSVSKSFSNVGIFLELCHFLFRYFLFSQNFCVFIFANVVNNVLLSKRTIRLT